jgi:hypothetical protein
MVEEPDPKNEAIHYWEIRRLLWNLLLVPPAFFAFSFVIRTAMHEHQSLPVFGGFEVAVAFCFAAVGANLCYSFAYVVEFWIQGAVAEDGYHRYGRPMLFYLGCVLGVGLALWGGVSIAHLLRAN